MTPANPAKPLTARDWRRHPLPAVDSTHSKDERGNVLVIAGSPHVPGAASLAGIAALRAGAGRLAVAAPPAAIAMIAARLPEAMLVPLRADAAFDTCLAAADSVVIGCGWDADAAARRWTRRVLDGTTRPIVVDAGALNGWREAPRPRRCVLTPHAGEMAKLSGHTRRFVEENPVRVARKFAEKMQCVLLLKGSTSYLVDADGPVWIFEGGHPGLGTSGSGDVLAGCIGGLLARGLEPLWAAAWGARLHGAAGRELARTVGPSGYLAREIAATLPAMMQRHARTA